jgi:SAM-dependent methyltransferase
MVLREHQDAYGREIYDYLNELPGHRDVAEIVERDDGYFDTSGGPKAYFSEYKHWLPFERKAMRFARGKVLDIGSGAGRHALYLQNKGLEVTAVDNSPLAIEVCRQRGIKHTSITPLNEISAELGIFDTVIMMGNNFGLFGSYKGAKRLLKKLHGITSERGRIIASSGDVYKTEIPEHLFYQESNRNKGRMGGQLRIRIRYKKYVTPWFDYLRVSKQELEDILENTGWQANKYLDSETAMYIAIIEKEKVKR